MKKNALHKTLLLMAMMGWAMTSYAQRYETDHGRVYYGRDVVMNADARNFVDLGFGYAKDLQHVYLNGRVLEYVDPTTFRLKTVGPGRHGNHEEGNYYNNYNDMPYSNRGYYKTKWNVYYGDNKIDAMPGSFKDLGYGYARDSFNVFYFGKKIDGAHASSFKILEDGYSKDSFNVYYYGERMDGVMSSSFKVTHDGYGEDNFNVYFRGRKLK